MSQNMEEDDITVDIFELIESNHWAACLSRITSHPSELHQRTAAQSRTPLHVACDHDAPAVIIRSMLRADPSLSLQVGSARMTALHITCSSCHASPLIVRVLLDEGLAPQCGMRDVDGDTPLHAACRCGAPQQVLEHLLRAAPNTVDLRDLEGLTPLLRLWVRYTVILGEALELVSGQGDLQGELWEAWRKTELLLRCAHQRVVEEDPTRPFQALHAASAVDCPRSVLNIAAKLYPEQFSERDEYGRTPLLIAAASPLYQVRDLSDEGYSLGDNIYGEQVDSHVQQSLQETRREPPVIEYLLNANLDAASSAACVPDTLGRLPLHVALSHAKCWRDGVQQLTEIYPDALSVPDPSSNLLPFMMCAIPNNTDLSTSYELLRRNPALLESLRCQDQELT